MTAMTRRRLLLQGRALIGAMPFTGFIGHASAGAITPRLLKIESRSIEVNKRAATVFGLFNEARAHGLTFTAGETFAVKLENAAAEPTLIHWHGLTPPFAQDGVPDVSQPMLEPGDAYAYSFPLTTAGTHWMHAHTLQEQQLLAAPLIVRDRAQQSADEQEVVIMLHDFSFKTPEEILAGLTGMGGMGGGAHEHGAGSGSGSGAGADQAQHAHGSGQEPPHARDIDYDAFLANDRTLDDPEVVAVERGGRVRLRIINGGAATGFLIDLGALTGELIAVDGQAVQPLKLKRVPLAMAQRADIRLTLPKEGGAFPILALQEDGTGRTGIVLATKGAPIAKLASQSKAKLGLLDAVVESSLRATAPLPSKPVDRVVEMTLVGSHMGYSWGLDLKSAGETLKTVPAKLGDRIEVRIANVTAMPHPMHLHGHHFQVTSLNGRAFSGAMRDTVNLPPRSRLSIQFDADNPGRWMFHCHHLYHMVSGMMTELGYPSA